MLYNIAKQNNHIQYFNEPGSQAQCMNNQY